MKIDGTQVTSSAIDGATGAFWASFDTHALAVAGSPYTVTYAYAGDANYLPLTDTSTTLTVTPAPLTVTGITAANKTYESTTTAALKLFFKSGRKSPLPPLFSSKRTPSITMPLSTALSRS